MLNIRNTVLILAIGLFANTLVAQKGTQSPYSSFGLGERNYVGFASFSGMGGVTLAITDSAIVNSNNPASYSYIGRHKPIFQVGLNGKLSTFSTETNSTDQRYFGLNQFQLGLPVAKNWGIGVGLKPYTFTGYTITEYVIDESDTTQQFVSEGAGGVRIANFGISYRALNKSTTDTVFLKKSIYDTITEKKLTKRVVGKRINFLSIGVNGNYLFGTSQQIRSSEFIPSTASSFNARVEKGLRISGLATEFGLNYQFGFQSASLSRVLSIGATYAPATEVRAYQDLFAKSYIGSYYAGESVITIDTVEYVNNNQGTILKPESYGLGFEYRISPYQTGSLLKIAVDFKMEKWSTYQTSFSDIELNGGLKDRTALGIGMEWTPKWGNAAFDPDNTFFSKMHYRLGFNYAQTELLVKDNIGNEVGIENYGMSFGLGLPILTGNSNTNLNFGVSLGNLGTTANGLIQEQYMGVYFGVAITPQRNSLWFLKRKYD